MQSSKSPQKNAKPAVESAAASETKTPKESVAAPRATRTSKKSEPVSTAAKNHRKAVPFVASEAVASPKAMAASAASAASRSNIAASTSPVTPTHEEIAALAYSYWVERGYQHGHEQADWARAVATLTHKA